MIWLILLCVILSVMVLTLGIKLILTRKAAEEIRIQFSEKLESDTNTLITISTGDKAMSALANDINILLRELQRQRRRYVQGDLELKNAVTNISHDLRTPLTAISGYLDLLDNVNLNETARRYIRIIRNRAETLERLTEELFRYSIITSPAADTSAEPVSVNAILEESILGFYAALQERNITPDIHMPVQRVIRRLDRATLSRVFSNLIHNAMKYSDGDLEITLTDSGIITFSGKRGRNLLE